MTVARVHWSDDAVEAVVSAVAGRTPGIVGLVPMLTRGTISISREADGPLRVVARVVTRLDPAPVEAVRAFGRAVKDELGTVTGLDVEVEITIVDIRP